MRAPSAPAASAEESFSVSRFRPLTAQSSPPTAPHPFTPPPLSLISFCHSLHLILSLLQPSPDTSAPVGCRVWASPVVVIV